MVAIITAHLLGGYGQRQAQPTRQERRTIRPGDVLQKGIVTTLYLATGKGLVWLDKGRIDNGDDSQAAIKLCANQGEPAPGKAIYRVVGLRQGVRYVVAGTGKGKPA